VFQAVYIGDRSDLNGNPNDAEGRAELQSQIRRLVAGSLQPIHGLFGRFAGFMSLMSWRFAARAKKFFKKWRLRRAK